MFENAGFAGPDAAGHEHRATRHSRAILEGGYAVLEVECAIVAVYNAIVKVYYAILAGVVGPDTAGHEHRTARHFGAI